MRPPFALRGMADCVLAWLAHRSEVLFDAKQDATCASLYASAFLMNVHPAAVVFTRAALHGSVKSWKCALVHSARRLPSVRSRPQNATTSRLQACMTGTYWLEAGDPKNTNIAKTQKILLTTAPDHLQTDACH